MKDLTKKRNKFLLGFLFTAGGMLASTGIMFLVLFLFRQPVTFVPLVAAIAAPLLIIPLVIWVLTVFLDKIHNLEMEMKKISTLDTLTGLLNRQPFFTSLESLYHLMVRNNASLALVHIDIDDFRQINKTCGFNAGDWVIHTLSKMIVQTCRKSDLIGRVGGEEFLLGLPNTGRVGALVVAEKIRIQLAERPMRFGSHDIKVTISAGVSAMEAGKVIPLETLLAQVEEGLVYAMKNGQNRVSDGR
jgi:diguanylate cyclase (GGDEF)-like protein